MAQCTTNRRRVFVRAMSRPAVDSGHPDEVPGADQPIISLRPDPLQPCTVLSFGLGVKYRAAKYEKIQRDEGRNCSEIHGIYRHTKSSWQYCSGYCGESILCTGEHQIASSLAMEWEGILAMVSPYEEPLQRKMHRYARAGSNGERDLKAQTHYIRQQRRSAQIDNGHSAPCQGIPNALGEQTRASQALRPLRKPLGGRSCRLLKAWHALKVDDPGTGRCLC
jgi:hypothetical protein